MKQFDMNSDCVDITLKNGQTNYSLKRNGIEIFSGTRLEYEIAFRKEGIKEIKRKLSNIEPNYVFVPSNEDPKIYLEKELWWFDVQTKFDCLSRFTGWIYELIESSKPEDAEGAFNSEYSVEKFFPNRRLGDVVMFSPPDLLAHLMRPIGSPHTTNTQKYTTREGSYYNVA